MLKLISSLLCAFPLSIFASTIPEYPINGKAGTLLMMSDAATFSVNEIYSGVAANWVGGDSVVFYQTDLTFFPAALSFQNDLPVFEPMIYIFNVNTGTTAVGFVESPPSISPVTIQTINPFLGTVILSDFTTWDVRPSDQLLFSFWQIGDAVMIGENLGSDRASYDAILLNTTHKSTAHVVEQ